MQTIYERYGGFPAIRRIVSDFYDRVLDSDVLAHHFERVDMPVLIDHQTRFVAFVTGGPVAAYTDEHLDRVHAHHRITLVEFDTMAEIFVETLEDHGMSADDRGEVERRLRARQPVIVHGR